LADLADDLAAFAHVQPCGADLAQNILHGGGAIDGRASGGASGGGGAEAGRTPAPKVVRDGVLEWIVGGTKFQLPERYRIIRPVRARACGTWFGA
jgi:hypothetical protein